MNAQYVVRFDATTSGLVLEIPGEVLIAPNGAWCHSFPLDMETLHDYRALGMNAVNAIDCVFHSHFVVAGRMAHRFLQERAFSFGFGWTGTFPSASDEIAELFQTSHRETRREKLVS